MRLLALSFLLVLVACKKDDKDEDTDTGDTAAVDADADGSPATEDCDDADATVYPGAPESCDTKDNDCDDAVDEEPVDGAAYYADADGDEYGQGEALVACEAPEGYAQVDGDCDDADPAIHPDADESDCTDPVDYNCDGSVGYVDADADGWAACEDCDDSDLGDNPAATEIAGNGDDEDCDGAEICFVDADDDAYVVSGAATVASADSDCLDAGEGTDAEPATDCLDTDASAYPGAPETCDTVDDDCDGEIDEEATDRATWYADADTDTYGDAATSTLACTQPSGFVADATDCLDTDASAYPGAPETCDDVDDDCDGTIDDEAVDQGTWYADADSDTYGDASTSTIACDAPSGYVADSTDCDDAASGTNPGAAEACGGGDEDCDGSTDESGSTGESTWYTDADADGYTVSGTLSACAEPSGYSAASGTSDCDDAASSTNPGAAEVCDDGIDNNCAVDACALSGTFGAADADVGIFGTTTTDTVGSAVTASGDLNGDGAHDLVVAGSGRDTGASNAGAVYVFYGPLDGTETLATADVVISGAEAGEAIGESAVEILPDVDGDGDDELLIGAAKRDASGADSGRTYLFLGGSLTTTTVASAYATMSGASASDYAGWSVQGVGDVDGGGTPDLVIGSYGRGGTDAGLAALVYGESVVAGDTVITTGADVLFTGSTTSGNLGWATGGADFDGDGLSDVAVGSPNQSSSTTTGGRVFVQYGDAALDASFTESGGSTSTAVDVVITAASVGDRLGYSLTGLDYDGDGYADLAVGADFQGASDNGAVYVAFGGSTRWSGTVGVTSAAGVTLTAESSTTGDFFGRSVETAGDVDGDGAWDLLVGATQNDAGGSGAGAVYLVYGGTASGSADGAAVKVAGGAASDAFGSRLGQGGDLNGDGRDDVVFGATGYDPSSVSAGGGAWVIFASNE